MNYIPYYIHIFSKYPFVYCLLEWKWLVVGDTMFIIFSTLIMTIRAFGSHQKKGKKFHKKCELWGGQQILVCEPQKSAFFRANFPKKHAEINS